MRHRAIVESQAFFGLLEIAADDVDELIERGVHLRIEGVQVVHRHHARFHIPLVLAHHLVGGFDIRLGLVIVTKDAPVQVGILIAVLLVFVEAQRLMISDSERHFFGNIGLDTSARPTSRDPL